MPLWKEEGREREHFIKVIHLTILSSSDLSCCLALLLITAALFTKTQDDQKDKVMLGSPLGSISTAGVPFRRYKRGNQKSVKKKKKASVIRNFNLQSWGKGVRKLNQRGTSRPGFLSGNCMPHPTADEA